MEEKCTQKKGKIKGKKGEEDGDKGRNNQGKKMGEREKKREGWQSRRMGKKRRNEEEKGGAGWVFGNPILLCSLVSVECCGDEHLGPNWARKRGKKGKREKKRARVDQGSYYVTIRPRAYIKDACNTTLTQHMTLG